DPELGLTVNGGVSLYGAATIFSGLTLLMRIATVCPDYYITSFYARYHADTLLSLIAKREDFILLGVNWAVRKDLQYCPGRYVYSVRTKVHEIQLPYFECLNVDYFTANRNLR
uniref:hypothetical protein n=1 Tax=Cronobacter TaxID=413496 RepID=UPI00131A06AF